MLIKINEMPVLTKANEIIEVAQILTKFNDMIEKPYTLIFHNGSMGETSETLSITVKSKDNTVLFDGAPQCLGLDSKSNYAYSEHDIVKPVSSIKTWLDTQFAGKLELVINDIKMVNEWHSIEVRYGFYNGWENCTVTSIETNVTYNKWLGIVELNNTIIEKYTNGNESITTIVVNDKGYTYNEQTTYNDDEIELTFIN